ncbi:hypothetical protein EYF80_031854 [Liparis tanakae]|uniref:Uncharacterized protein n=1 Tax=Liparis tanakae TaxID=230148 RepID=A0A4Z2GWI3_9TELE|nr:hypothetical protein EYF80_031854 [Liparis tanakae]
MELLITKYLRLHFSSTDCSSLPSLRMYLSMEMVLSTSAQVKTTMEGGVSWAENQPGVSITVTCRPSTSVCLFTQNSAARSKRNSSRPMMVFPVRLFPGHLQPSTTRRTSGSRLAALAAAFLASSSGPAASLAVDLGVGVRVLQSLPLKLDGGEGAIDLRELLLQALLPLQGLQGS